MRLNPLDAAAAAALQAEHLGVPPNALAVTAELLRCEVSARGVGQRAAILARVRQLALVAATGATQQVERVCAQLESLGDILALPGGKLAAAPLRCVQLENETGLLLAGAATQSLAHWLGEAPVVHHLRRHLPWRADTAARVVAIGGKVLEANQWARLDASMTAGPDFIADLDTRLAAMSPENLSPVADDADWRAWLPAAGAMGWRKANGRATLWRSANQWGSWTYAWTDGAVPAVTYMQLRQDDARRAQFALASQAGLPAQMTILADAQHLALRLPWWLPAPEYRWMTLHAELAQSDQLGWHWLVPAESAAVVLNKLHERLAVDRPEGWTKT